MAVLEQKHIVFLKMLKCGMSESGVSVQEPRTKKHSAKDPQMGFEISDGKFTVPPTIIETFKTPTAFERISNRLQWQEAKLGNNCVFFELGEEKIPNGEGGLEGILFNGNNWQLRDKVSLETPLQQPNLKLPKFDAVVIHAGNFSKNQVQLSEILKKTGSRMGYNKPVYISVARQENLDAEQLKLTLSKMVQDARFIKPNILFGIKGKNEDILFETRTKVRRHNILPVSNKTTESDETELEAARLREKTPEEIRRESFIKAKFNPDRLIPNGKKCFHCKGPLHYLSHAEPDRDGAIVNVMYNWCLEDGQRGNKILLRKNNG